MYSSLFKINLSTFTPARVTRLDKGELSTGLTGILTRKEREREREREREGGRERERERELENTEKRKR